MRSDDGRFVGVRVNEEEVPRLPIFPAQWAIDDPRQRSYLVVWGNGAYALKMAVSEGGARLLRPWKSRKSGLSLHTSGVDARGLVLELVGRAGGDRLDRETGRFHIDRHFVRTVERRVN